MAKPVECVTTRVDLENDSLNNYAQRDYSIRQMSFLSAKSSKHCRFS